MQAIRESDACHEYLIQLVDRFCTEYGRGSPLAVWALGALSTSVADRTGHASSALPDETTEGWPDTFGLLASGCRFVRHCREFGEAKAQYLHGYGLPAPGSNQRERTATGVDTKSRRDSVLAASQCRTPN
jgi:hypothetical protein